MTESSSTSELCVARLEELAAILETPDKHIPDSAQLWQEFALHNIGDQLDSINMRLVNLNTVAHELSHSIKSLAAAVEKTGHALDVANEMLNTKALL